MLLLEIKNLFFQVGTAKILDDLRLSVEAAEVHAPAVGANGTGKSTLAYLVVGCGVSTSSSLRNNFSSLQPGGSLCV